MKCYLYGLTTINRRPNMALTTVDFNNISANGIYCIKAVNRTFINMSLDDRYWYWLLLFIQIL